MANKITFNFDQLKNLNSESMSNEPVGEVAGEQILQVLLHELIPDPNQPRRILPDEIRNSYYEGKITAKKAMGLYIEVTLEQTALLGRTYNSVWDLAQSKEGNSDNHEKDPNDNLLPNERRLRDLVVLALTIQENGILNPLIVIEFSYEDETVYKVIAGSRRFWASVLLAYFMPNYDKLVTLPCRLVSNDHNPVFQQAVENSTRSNLNAAELVRQLAILLLTVNEIPIPEGKVEDEFYLEASKYDLKELPEKYTAKQVYDAMGLSRFRFSQLKTLLKLSPLAMWYGGENDLSERTLRELVSLPESEQNNVITFAIELDWSEREIAEQVKANKGVTHEKVTSDPSKAFANKIRTVHGLKAKQVAESLKKKEGTYESAISRLQTLRTFLDKVQHELRILEETQETDSGHVKRV